MPIVCSKACVCNKDTTLLVNRIKHIIENDYKIAILTIYLFSLTYIL